MTRHWLCTACDRQYDAEPLKCECGRREFLAVAVAPTLEHALGVRVDAFAKDGSCDWPCAECDALIDVGGVCAKHAPMS